MRYSRISLLAGVDRHLTARPSEQLWKFVKQCWNLKMAKILIVEDSVFTRKLITMIVEDAGHEVVGFAGDGEQALKLFKSLRPELVLLDYLIPNKDGKAVLKEMILHDSSARVIMISGSGDHTLGERALQIGAKIFLEKTHLQRDILKAIDQVMEI